MGDNGHFSCAAMLCPCRCGQVIQLNLVVGTRPVWTVEIDSDTQAVTLRPSIWRTKGCRSHFLLRRGRVRWASRTGSEDLGESNGAIISGAFLRGLPPRGYKRQRPRVASNLPVSVSLVSGAARFPPTPRQKGCRKTRWILTSYTDRVHHRSSSTTAAALISACSIRSSPKNSSRRTGTGSQRRMRRSSPRSFGRRNRSSTEVPPR